MRKKKGMTDKQKAAELLLLETLSENTTPDKYRETLRKMREILTAPKATKGSKKTSDTPKK